MATLVLQTVGSIVGGAVGGPFGAAIGRALGGLAGGAIDNSLFGGGSDNPRVVEGPRLKEMDGLTSQEGAAIPRIYGRARLGGQIIWATRFEEVMNTTVERSGTRGGKGIGGGGGASGPTTVTKTYSYLANLAVGLCEGPISFVRRVWADGRELDLATVTMRVHQGTETQDADPLIVAKEGATKAPAYRGLAYVVFERLPLARFGNRVPQLSFEVVRAVDGLAHMIKAVCLIPGATEFGYDTIRITQTLGLGSSRPENRHQLRRSTDVAASLDALEALCPNLKRVSVVVSWFGDDLRAGSCSIEPRVDSTGKKTDGDTWAVAGLTRATARPVTKANGVPAYGGTPSDDSVVRLIKNLKARGLEVVLYPFVMMDIAAGNSLPNPYGGTSQPAYPWRGRITCHPAPGEPGSPDGTADAGTQVKDFFTGTWGFGRFIRHYAKLAKDAGGVDGFIIGSELLGLTRVRSGAGSYPAVAELRTLAQDVRVIVGSGTDLVYAADWTEYGAHVRDNGAELRFPLDPLWADPVIDAIGIDYYPPISDWRDGAAHTDLIEARSIYDVNYLRHRLGAGEAFDWYYASAADRMAQQRTPITDGAYGKPWVYRAKDLVSWWSNPHRERVGGIEVLTTAWTPRSKPIWLTELGVPAMDKGTNGPNVFPDPKSSESALPPFSRGTRDDLVQARGLEAILSRFDPALDGFEEAFNPVSPVYGERMVDPGRMFVWAWDARPFPAFPDFDKVWADGANWDTGHWLTGRLEGMPIDRLIAAILKDFDIAAGMIAVDGFVDGYGLDRPLSARAALEPLARLFGIDVATTGGALVWRGRGGRSVTTLEEGDFVLNERDPALKLSRTQETELPHQVELGFTDGEGEYRRAAVASRRLAGSSRREVRTDAAIVTRRAEAQRLADICLQDAWAARETAEFELSPRRIDIEPGDVIKLPTGAGAKLHRVVRISDAATRKVSTRAVEPAVFEMPGSSEPRPGKDAPPLPGKPVVLVLDLPAARSDPPGLQFIGVAADPWPGAAVVWRSGDGASFTPHRFVELPAIIGETLTAFPPGPLWRWDVASSVDVTISSGALQSVSDDDALAGANLFAIRGVDGRWEILCAAHAKLVGERTYRLSRFLRGLAGSEPEAERSVPPGAVLVRLDEAIVPLTSTIDDLGKSWIYRVAPEDTDHADSVAVQFTATAGADALKPLSPVRVSARRDVEGIHISWIRRARLDGDPWDPIDVPIGETQERYELDIIGGGVIRRTITSQGSTILYSAAQELADFGTAQTTLTLSVAQISAAVGRGFERTVTVAVK